MTNGSVLVRLDVGSNSGYVNWCTKRQFSSSYLVYKRLLTTVRARSEGVVVEVRQIVVRSAIEFIASGRLIPSQSLSSYIDLSVGYITHRKLWHGEALSHHLIREPDRHGP